MRSALVVLTMLMLAMPAAADLRDPTRPSYAAPAVVGESQPTGIRVSAVFIRGSSKVAIVNGRRVREGDAVGDAIVSQIEQDRVHFVRGGEAFTVSLLSSSGAN